MTRTRQGGTRGLVRVKVRRSGDGLWCEGRCEGEGKSKYFIRIRLGEVEHVWGPLRGELRILISLAEETAK
jgi:hypothetical protein